MSGEHAGLGFRDVDKTDEPAFYARYLDQMHANPQFQERKERMYAALALRPGDAALDAGCGVGTDLLALAALVGPAGRAVGIDQNEALLAEARGRAAAVGAVELERGDLHALPFPNATFDGCHLERALMHVADPCRVLAEVVRTLRPGGRFVALEPDIEAYLFDYPDSEGRAAAARLRAEAGLADIAVTPANRLAFGAHPADFPTQVRQDIERARQARALTEVEADAYLAWLDASLAAGTFLGMSASFLVSARKP